MLTRPRVRLSSLPLPLARAHPLPTSPRRPPLTRAMSDLPEGVKSADSGADTPLSLSALSSALPSHEPSRGTTPVPQSLSHTAEAGPSTLRMSVIDKWLKPDGPPRDVPFGARKLAETDDVFSMNAWWVLRLGGWGAWGVGREAGFRGGVLLELGLLEVGGSAVAVGGTGSCRRPVVVDGGGAGG